RARDVAQTALREVRGGLRLRAPRGKRAEEPLREQTRLAIFGAEAGGERAMEIERPGLGADHEVVGAESLLRAEHRRVHRRLQQRGGEVDRKSTRLNSS